MVCWYKGRAPYEVGGTESLSLGYRTNIANQPRFEVTFSSDTE